MTSLDFVKSVYARFWRSTRIDKSYKKLSLAETFQNIYRAKVWGDSGEPFCSGDGLRGRVTTQYCDLVVKFIRGHQVQTVVDLGCGNFAVGRQFVKASVILYTGGVALFLS